MGVLSGGGFVRWGHCPVGVSSDGGIVRWGFSPMGTLSGGGIVGGSFVGGGFVGGFFVMDPYLTQQSHRGLFQAEGPKTKEFI